MFHYCLFQKIIFSINLFILFLFLVRNNYDIITSPGRLLMDGIVDADLIEMGVENSVQRRAVLVAIQSLIETTSE